MFVNSHNLIKFKSPTLYILEHIYLPTHPYQLQLYFISSSNFLTKKELTIQYILYTRHFAPYIGTSKISALIWNFFLRMEALISSGKNAHALLRNIHLKLGSKYSTGYRLGIWRRLLLEKVQYSILFKDLAYAMCMDLLLVSKTVLLFCKCRFLVSGVPWDFCPGRFLIYILYSIQSPFYIVFRFA